MQSSPPSSLSRLPKTGASRAYSLLPITTIGLRHGSTKPSAVIAICRCGTWRSSCNPDRIRALHFDNPSWCRRCSRSRTKYGSRPMEELLMKVSPSTSAPSTRRVLPAGDQGHRMRDRGGNAEIPGKVVQRAERQDTQRDSRPGHHISDGAMLPSPPRPRWRPALDP